MDPVTQGAFGAVFTQLNNAQKGLGKSAVIGALAGMAPDLDILIRSSADPLLALEYHRHFTHSLLFIPVGGFLCASLFYQVFGKRWGLSFAQVWMWSCIGYATHGLLDGCTSYGTQLLWPLSNKRFAWDVISVVDPLVTLPLLFCIFLAVKKGKFFTWLGVSWLAFYFSMAGYQHQRALRIGHEMATANVGKYQNLQVKPSLANILVWKVIYETEEAFYVAAVRPGFNRVQTWPGDKVQKLNVARDLPWLAPGSQQAKDVERFRWFSDGFIALDHKDPYRVVDIRYSVLPHQIAPLWGIQLAPGASSDKHAQFDSPRERPVDAWRILWAMIIAAE